MRSFKVIVLVTFAFLITACSGFDKLLKTRDYPLMYKKGLEYYEAKDHYKYTTIFEQLTPIYKGTQQADTIEFYLSNGYYNQGDYLLAAHYFDRFRQNYPRSQFVEQAEFMYAYCFYKSSPRPLLDQETTQAAISAFSQFITRYPNTERKAEVNRILVDLRSKLVEKSYLSAKLYYDMQDYKAAITALKNSVNQFPSSEYREEMLYMILQASFNLADNSVPEKRRERFQNTMDEYFNLLGEFPETKYKREAERIYANSIRIIENK
jgi:outer membrane protein assembly factor BamD